MSESKTVFQNTPEAAAVADIVRKSCEPRVLNVRSGEDKAEILLLPTGTGSVQAVSVKKLLDEYRTEPERRTGTAKLKSLDSFISHVQRFMDGDSIVFVDSEEGHLLAVLDYHRAGASSAPRFGVHRALYEFPFSDAWEAWSEKAGSWMPQTTFAEFVESRVADVTDPQSAFDSAKEFAKTFGVTFAGPSRLLELSRGLTVSVGATVRQHVNLASGESTIAYEEKHADAHSAPLKVPGAFLLAIPVFQHGAPYQIPVRLRYRVQNGSVVWSCELYRADVVREHAIEEACERVRVATALPVLHGSPEATSP